MKILFRNTPFTDQQKETLNALCVSGGYTYKWYDKSEEVLFSDLQDAEVLMGYFPNSLLKSLTNLKWHQVPSAGVDSLCSDVYASDSVILTNSSGAFGVAISEYMLTGVLMLMRNMPAYGKNQRARLWQEEGVSRTIYKSVITVVGMGDIGTEFAKRAKALGAYIRGVKRTPGAPNEIYDEVYTTKDLKKAVMNADAVVMSLPATNETRHLLSEEILAAMGEKTIIVNCGRGVTIDESALIKALMDKKIAGAVLDVCECEPLSKDSLLWDLENVVLTPHISGRDTTPVNAEKIFEIFKENLTRYIEHRPLMNVVDRKIGY
ncbi:MAG: D-2-hydroxyacid dehydrogenase [Clostridia bacterium]|nr:D-2-hydroxyacid dehydrogenase [Clostridia bacterium]